VKSPKVKNIDQITFQGGKSLTNEPSITMIAVVNARSKVIDQLEDKFPETISKFLAGYPNYQEIFDENSGGKFTRSILVRSLYYETVLKKHAPFFDQIILLSSGLDTRALQLVECSDKKIFNLDHPASHALTKGIFKASRIDDSLYTYVPFDLSGDLNSLQDDLIEKGFRSQLSTLVLWEGSSFYFGSDDFYKVLRFFSRFKVRFHFDFANYREQVGVHLKSSELLMKNGEPWVGFHRPQEVSSKLKSFGYRSLKVIDRSEIERELTGKSELISRTIYYLESSTIVEENK
jgi:methyltransferase (TIGR00027 family)